MNMTDAKALLIAADERFDQGDYAGARDAYRAALLAGEVPIGAVLENLRLAEQHERLRLVGLVREQHGGSVDSALAEAQLWIELRREELAIAICSRLLATELSEDDALKVRLLRHRAGSRHGAETLPDDFELIWRLGDRNPAARSFRRDLLRQLVAIDRTEAIGVLQAIVARLPSEPKIAAMVMTKIHELEAFAELIAC
jgi:hypothetical protein